MAPDGWTQRRIDELGAVRSGRQRAPQYTKGTKRPYLRVANVFDGLIDTSDVLEMNFTDREFAEYRLKSGDILLNEGQSLALVGRSAIYKGEPADCCFQNTLIRFRPGSDILAQYAQYLFQHLMYTGQFAAIASQTTSIAHLGLSRLASLQVLVPSIVEQRNIVRILDAWDRAIMHTTALTKSYRARRRGLMQQLLSGTVRWPDHARTPWQHFRLNEVLKGVNRPVEWGEDTLYRLASVRRWSGGVFDRESLFGHQIKVKKLHTIRTGDFLISHIQAAYGAMALVPSEFDGATVSEGYTILVPNDKSLDIRYLGYLAEMPELRHKAYMSSNGFFAERLRLNFNPEDFLKQSVYLPTEHRAQAKTADLLDFASLEIQHLEQELTALRKQKQALMQKLLNGKTRPPLNQEV